MCFIHEFHTMGVKSHVTCLEGLPRDSQRLHSSALIISGPTRSNPVALLDLSNLPTAEDVPCSTAWAFCYPVSLQLKLESATRESSLT